MCCWRSSSASGSGWRTGWSWAATSRAAACLRQRQAGLPAPWLVVTDGAPGLVRAVEELWPEADRQRCSVHRLPCLRRQGNILAKLPKRADIRRRVQAAYWAALDEAASPEDAEARLRTLVAALERAYPSAAACLAEDLPALCVHLRYPLHLRRRLRSTNLLERSLGEVQRRVRVIGRFPGETSCLPACRWRRQA